ncbi:MAG TPA: hypothetical protein VMU30_11245 [Bacteroidota bacterium]|nr:hypothetical protein [Bacteroidota bacterium]
MLRGLKIVHFCGLVLSLGSIFTFIVISALLEGASLENIVFGRKIISTGTNVLTVPGILVLAITGVLDGIQALWLEKLIFPAQAPAHYTDCCKRIIFCFALSKLGDRNSGSFACTRSAPSTV